MKELKFRAMMPEKNAKFHFTLKDLMQDKFSNREILWKWLEEGNQPDLFTGAKDKNGREIYEEDIVRYNNKLTGVIVWKYTGFTLELFNKKKSTIILWYDVDSKDNIEVIGNIYENPCLLYTSPSPRDRQKSRMPSSA